MTLRNAQTLRVILLKGTLTALAAALAKLRAGQGLTAGESGVQAEPPLTNAQLIETPRLLWNGTDYVCIIFATSN